MNNILSQKEKKIIFNDWRSNLKVYTPNKPMHLLKRNGPILTGIYFRIVYGKQHYSPEFHTHSLFCSFPVITSTSTVQLKNNKGAIESFSFFEHEKNFDSIIERFKGMSQIISEGEISCSQLIEIYEHAFHNPCATPYQFQLLMDHVLVLWWCEKFELAEEKLEQYKPIIKKWELEGVNIKYNDWLSKIESLMNKNIMEKIIEEEVNKFKLIELKDYGLICDG
ncbi:hypothetical protein [Pragia fontium]|uniref:hypothetical protein n=1 Tax=Pragia fontium TaxID=82985 RepID=UPI000F6BBA98|nr:hypothetical protein [Pragia fontium]VEJ57113.1 Uncharacterised protein [Pragia fontium]